MKKYILLPIIAIMALVLQGCQNNGHIGWIFGVWRVAEYTVDGQRVDNPLIETTTIAFQGGVVEVVAITDQYQSANESYGSWEENGNELILNFCNKDNQLPSGTEIYEAPSWLGMTSSAPMHLAISDRKGDGVTLTWTDDNGLKKVYKLRKTW